MIQTTRKIITLTSNSQEVLIPLLKDRTTKMGKRIFFVDDLAIHATCDCSMLLRTTADDEFFDGITKREEYSEIELQTGEIFTISDDNDNGNNKMMKVGSVVVNGTVGEKVFIEFTINR